jgi:hypothetical protein
MGKAVVLNCDICKVWDSEENPVRSVTVAGPRFDLCANDRVKLIVAQGVDPRKARAYVTAFDNRESTRGSGLSLNGKAVREELRAGTDETAPDGTTTEDSTASAPGEPAEGSADVSGSDPRDDDNPDEEADEDQDQAAAEWADQVLAEVTGEDDTESEEPRTPAQKSSRRAKART